MLTRYYYEHKTAAQVAASAFETAVLALTPTRYWRLGESSGVTATDETGTQDGTYANTPTLGVSGITTDGDTAVTFASASSQAVSTSHSADYNYGTGDFSVMFGVNVTSWPTATSFVMAHDGFGAGAWGVYLVASNNGLYRLLMNGVDYALNAGAAGGSGAWRFIGISADRDANAVLYLDGSAAATATISGASGTDLSRTASFYIARQTSSNYLNGSLDEVALWKGSLLTSGDWSTLQAAR